jgi:hypothetical protein
LLAQAEALPLAAKRAPANCSARPAPQPFQGVLAGHQVRAEPLRTESGQTTWRVSVSGPAGELGSLETKFSGQLGAAQLAGGSPLKRQVLAMVAQQRSATAVLGPNGRPAQPQRGGVSATFFDDRVGVTWTVNLPLYKEDNFNLGGYFTQTGGRRIPLRGWSPEAARGHAQQVIPQLVAQGLVGSRQIQARQAHERVFGGDGGQYWLPTAKTTFRDGQAAFRAREAARIPTAGGPPPCGTAEFNRGWHEARRDDRNLAGVAVASAVLGVAGLGVQALRLPQGYTLQGPGGRTLTASWPRGRPGQQTVTLQTPHPAGGVRAGTHAARSAPASRQTAPSGPPASPQGARAVSLRAEPTATGTAGRADLSSPDRLVVYQQQVQWPNQGPPPAEPATTRGESPFEGVPLRSPPIHPDASRPRVGIRPPGPRGPGEASLGTRELPPGEVPTAPAAASFVRRGLHLSLGVPNSYELFVRVWSQDGLSLPPVLWPGLMNNFSRPGPMEAVGEVLSKLPPNLGWRVSIFPPAPVGLSSFGVERLSSLVIPIKPSIESGGVLFDPQTNRYRLNTRETPVGQELLAPFPLEVVEARGFAPFDVLGVPPLPLHPNWKGEVLKVWKLDGLSGPIDARLLAALTRAINQGPMGKELWYFPGDFEAVAKWRVRFALPGSFPREGTYRLPRGWSNLASKLVPEGLSPDQVFKMDIAGIHSHIGLARFGVHGYRQRISSKESPPTPFSAPDRVIEPVDAPIAPMPSALVFQPPTDSAQPLGRLVLYGPSPSDHSVPVGGHLVQPEQSAQLSFAGSRGSVQIRGTVLNALNGHPVQPADLAGITRFLRSLDLAASGRGLPGGGVLSWNAAAVHAVMSAFKPGEPLPQEAVEAIYDAMARFARSLPSEQGLLRLSDPQTP